MNIRTAPALILQIIALSICAVSTALGQGLGLAPALHPPVKVIFDTDMETDCDDVGALALLHALADLGEVELLATVSSSKNKWSPPCIDAINTFYGRPDLPVGAPKRAGVDLPSRYLETIAREFPNDIGTGENVPDALEIYREVLSRQPDHSVVVISVGFLTNISDLLKMPADRNGESGMDLVRKKVKAWVCMGGNFVGYPARDNLKLGNHNFEKDAAASYYSIRNWPGKILFVGREIGSVPSGLEVGSALRKLPPKHIIRRAYELWFGGRAGDRHVADQVTCLIAVRGNRPYWKVEEKGYMDIRPDATFAWKYDKPNRKSRQSYILKRQPGKKADDRKVENIIEKLMLH